jgi:hypothetical protein
LNFLNLVPRLSGNEVGISYPKEKEEVQVEFLENGSQNFAVGYSLKTIRIFSLYIK